LTLLSSMHFFPLFPGSDNACSLLTSSYKWVHKPMHQHNLVVKKIMSLSLHSIQENWRSVIPTAVQNAVWNWKAQRRTQTSSPIHQGTTVRGNPEL
jgi:hypothetical protein